MLRQIMMETSYWSRQGRSGRDEPGLEAIGGRIHKQRTLNTRYPLALLHTLLPCHETHLVG